MYQAYIVNTNEDCNINARIQSYIHENLKIYKFSTLNILLTLMYIFKIFMGFYGSRNVYCLFKPHFISRVMKITV